MTPTEKILIEECLSILEEASFPTAEVYQRTTLEDIGKTLKERINPQIEKTRDGMFKIERYLKAIIEQSKAKNP